MKKILFAIIFSLPIFLSAQANISTFDNRNSSLNIICIQTAIDKRENSLISGHDALNNMTKNALETRKSSLKSAWAIENGIDRRNKRYEVYKTFKANIQTAHANMRSVRKLAWDNFEKEMIACGVPNHGELLQRVSLPAFEL